MKLLITGANGFIGLALVDILINENFDITALMRAPSLMLHEEVLQVVVGDLKGWSENNSLILNKIKESLQNVDVVIHLAARVHVMVDHSDDPFAEFRFVNRDATLALARLASKAGVKRFIYLSSIGVNGDNTARPFTEQDNPNPRNAYAISKHKAELSLTALANSSNMDVVVIRPPLVYGSNAPGNFASLIKWINKGIPLPFGAIYNQRSFVSIDNLVSFIVCCIRHPKAANRVFLISDGEDVSTTELLQKVAKAFDKRSWLIPVPVCLMSFAARLIGKGMLADRLFGSLQVDSSKARNLLDWRPITTMDEQLKKTADAYLKK